MARRFPRPRVSILAAGGGLLVGLAGCGATPEAKPPSAAVTDTGPAAAPAACAPDLLPPRQLRLLTRREYAATVRDLFAELSDGGAARDCETDADCSLRSEQCTAGTCAALPCGTVGFWLEADADAVVVASDANGWAATEAEGAWALAHDPALGLWRGHATVPEGTWRYKLVLDGTDWVTDPAATAVEDDGHGGENALLVVDCSDEDAGEADGGAGPLVPAVVPLEDFPVESRSAEHDFDNSVEGGLVTTTRAQAFLEASAVLAQQLVLARHELLPCRDAALTDPDCVGPMVAALGSRIHRRPLTAAEQERATARITGADDPVVGLERVLRGMLASPHFLYRSELGDETAPGIATLDAWETASLLSYTLWGSAPDAALRAAAADGTLATAEGRAQLAVEMLDDPRATERLAWFGTQWLGLEGLTTATKATERYPLWSPALRDAMLAEAGHRVTDELLHGEGTLPGLLTTPRTRLDASLAALYGVDAPETGSGRTLLPDDRAGLAGMAAVLAATAHSDQTSPVRRGLWVRERLLCQDLGTPPANAGGVPELDPTATTRERFAQHSSDPACASCHQYIDTVGFGFEGYDAIGAARTTDGGQPVDDSGSVLGLEGIGGTDRIAFAGTAELARIVAASDAAPACFVQTTWAWTLGRAAADACTLDTTTAAFRAAGQDHRALVAAVVASPAFVQRRTD